MTLNLVVAVESSGRPKPRHGIQPLTMKFWTAKTDSEEDDDDQVEEENDLSTIEFIATAEAEGFSVADLLERQIQMR